MKNTLKIISLFTILLLAISCGTSTKNHNEGDENHESHNDEKKEVEEKKSNKISLQLTQLDVMNIELNSVKQINIGKALKVNGQLELPPQKQASVSSIIGGKVSFVNVIEGDFVPKGKILARLSTPEIIKIQQEYLSAKSRIRFLEKDYLRKKELVKDGIVSSKSFQQTEADFLEGTSTLNTTKANLQLIGINIDMLNKGQIVSSINVIAPIKGYIQKVEINIGKFVSAEQELFEIVDNEHLHIGLKVFEKDIDKVKVGQKINFSLTTKSDKIYEAEIFALGKAFDMETRSVKVHAKIIGNHRGLITGMFVDARIATTNKKVDALPNEAFINEDGLDYIFIQKEKDKDDITFEKIKVNKGVSDLGFSEVVFITKIAANTQIVTKGAYYIDAELNKGEFEEHAH